MNKTDKLISIIIPCYNCGEWLSKSINSLIKQTKNNFEVIFVDDGSKDDSYDQARDILEKSKLDYKIIKQKNNGVSVARNTGIESSTGKYLYFLDADDYVEDNFVEVITEIVCIKEYDMIFGNYFIRKDDSTEEMKNKEYGEYECNYLLKVILGNKFRYHMCSAVIKRDIVIKNNIEFMIGCRYGEDHEFIIKNLCNSNKIYVSNKFFYNYCIRAGSTIHKFSINRLDSIDSSLRVKEYVDFKHPQLSKFSQKYVAVKMLFNLREYSIINDTETSSDDKKKCKNKLIEKVKQNKKYIDYLYYDENRSIKNKFMRVIVKYNPRIYMFFKGNSLI